MVFVIRLLLGKAIARLALKRYIRNEVSFIALFGMEYDIKVKEVGYIRMLCVMARDRTTI